MTLQRCEWAAREPLIHYHDEEWGVPVHDDRTLFEFLILEGAQAGLSWETILKKREQYRAAARRPRDLPQPAQGRRRHHQRAGVPRRPGRVRQLRRLYLAIRRRPAA